MTTRVQTLGASGRIYLVVRNLQADAPPGVLYDIYLDLPTDATPEQKRQHRVGTINFFHAIGHGASGHTDAPDHDAHQAGEQNMLMHFDITNVVRSLLADGRLGEKPTVSIAPAGTPADEVKPVVGEVSLVEP